MFVAIGFSRRQPGARREVYEQCKEHGYELITLRQLEGRRTGTSSSLGDNCFVFEENVIQPNVRIGNDVILWSGNHIGHDSTIDDHCFIASHVVISGNVHDRRVLASSASTRPSATGSRSRRECVIGAGALIMKDTVEGGVYSVRGTEPLEKKSWELTGF